MLPQGEQEWSFIGECPPQKVSRYSAECREHTGKWAHGRTWPTIYEIVAQAVSGHTPQAAPLSAGLGQVGSPPLHFPRWYSQRSRASKGNLAAWERRHLLGPHSRAAYSSACMLGLQQYSLGPVQGILLVQCWAAKENWLFYLLFEKMWEAAQGEGVYENK